MKNSMISVMLAAAFWVALVALGCTSKDEPVDTAKDTEEEKVFDTSTAPPATDTAGDEKSTEVVIDKGGCQYECLPSKTVCYEQKGTIPPLVSCKSPEGYVCCNTTPSEKETDTGSTDTDTDSDVDSDVDSDADTDTDTDTDTDGDADSETQTDIADPDAGDCEHKCVDDADQCIADGGEVVADQSCGGTQVCCSEASDGGDDAGIDEDGGADTDMELETDTAPIGCPGTCLPGADCVGGGGAPDWGHKADCAGDDVCCVFEADTDTAIVVDGGAS